jgi:TolB protein
MHWLQASSRQRGFEMSRFDWFEGGTRARQLSWTAACCIAVAALGLHAAVAVHAQTKALLLGLFDGASDIGVVIPAGISSYDAKAKTYTVTAAGADIWFKADDMHYVWKKMSGDVSFEADVDIQTDGVPHRKAVLMLRQSLDADAVYADASLHGDRMTAIQARTEKGGITTDIELHRDAPAPKRLRIEKRGDTMTMWLSMHGEPMQQAGKSMQVHLEGPFYAGLGVCSHDKDNVERVVFSNVELKAL